MHLVEVVRAMVAELGRARAGGARAPRREATRSAARRPDHPLHRGAGADRGGSRARARSASLSPEGERWLGARALEQHRSEFVFVIDIRRRSGRSTRTPRSARVFNSFDLPFRGTELAPVASGYIATTTSGGARVARYVARAIAKISTRSSAGCRTRRFGDRPRDSDAAPPGAEQLTRDAVSTRSGRLAPRREFGS
jgi:hypothetical protein